MSFEIKNPNYSSEALEEVVTEVISRNDLIDLISCRAETTEAARTLCAKMLLEKNPACCQSWKK